MKFNKCSAPVGEGTYSYMLMWAVGLWNRSRAKRQAAWHALH